MTKSPLLLQEVLMSLRRLVCKYGAQISQEWGIILQILNTTNEILSFKTDDKIRLTILKIVGAIESLIAQGEYSGDPDSFFKVLEVFVPFLSHESASNVLKNQVCFFIHSLILSLLLTHFFCFFVITAQVCPSFLSFMASKSQPRFVTFFPPRGPDFDQDSGFTSLLSSLSTPKTFNSVQFKSIQMKES